MIVGHHLTPFAVAAEMRGLCDVIGQLISVLLLRVSETEELAGRLRRHYAITSLGRDIEAVGGVAEGLQRQSAVVLDLMQATGGLIRCGGSTSLIGQTPDLDTATAMVGRAASPASRGHRGYRSMPASRVVWPKPARRSQAASC